VVIELIEGLPDNVAGFEAKGEVTDGDYESVLIPTVDRIRDEYGKVRCLYVLGEEFDGYSAGAMWDDAKIGMAHPRSWEKCAIVTDLDWLRSAVKAFGWLVSGEVKVFANAELTDAKEWVAA
jgi:hypothetical protein